MSDDEKTVIRGPAGQPADGPAPEPDKKAKAEQALDGFFKGSRQLTDEEKAQKKIKAISKSDLKQLVLNLIDELAGKSCAEHIKEIYGLRDKLDGLHIQHERQIEILQREADAKRTASEKALRDEIEKLKREHAAELERVRREAAGEAQARIVELERLLAMEQGRAADLDAKLAAALAEIARLNAELAALRKQLSGEDARTKAELLKLIGELQARILELELALDYFDLEEEFEGEPFQQRAEALSKKLEAAGAAAGPMYRTSRQAASDASAALKKFELLRQVMHENKASIAVVVDMVKQLREADKARARVEVAEQADGK